MARRILLDHDPEMGMMQFIEPDEGGITLITRGTNIQDALKRNAEMRRDHNSVKRGDQTWGHLVGSIPMHVWETWCRENPELRAWTQDAQVWLLNRLNDVEYQNLKVYDGGVGLVRQV